MNEETKYKVFRLSRAELTALAEEIFDAGRTESMAGNFYFERQWSADRSYWYLTCCQLELGISGCDFVRDLSAEQMSDLNEKLRGWQG